MQGASSTLRAVQYLIGACSTQILKVGTSTQYLVASIPCTVCK